jgi:cyanate permease
MLAGTVGVLGLGRAVTTAWFAVATLLAFAAGWGWPGLFQLTVTRSNPEAPAAATGVTQTGAFVGSALGPLMFGWLVESTSYAAAWAVMAGMLFTGAFVMLGGHRALLAERTRSLVGGT